MSHFITLKLSCRPYFWSSFDMFSEEFEGTSDELHLLCRARSQPAHRQTTSLNLRVTGISHYVCWNAHFTSFCFDFKSKNKWKEKIKKWVQNAWECLLIYLQLCFRCCFDTDFFLANIRPGLEYFTPVCTLLRPFLYRMVSTKCSVAHLSSDLALGHTEVRSDS